jgi:hypothetical protein
MAIRECTNCGEMFDFPDEAWEKLSSKKRENIVCYECDWDMEPADFTFEQQCLSPAERQAEQRYYDELKHNRHSRMTPHQKNKAIFHLLKGYSEVSAELKQAQADAAELRRQLALMTELMAGYEQLLDVVEPRWRGWVGK